MCQVFINNELCWCIFLSTGQIKNLKSNILSGASLSRLHAYFTPEWNISPYAMGLIIYFFIGRMGLILFIHQSPSIIRCFKHIGMMQTSQTLWVKLQTSSKVPIIQLPRIEDWLQKEETLGRSNTGDFMPWLGIAEIAAGNHVFSVVIFIPSLQADSQLWCFFEQWMVSFWEVECHQLQPPGVYQMMPVNSYQPQAWSK